MRKDKLNMLRVFGAGAFNLICLFSVIYVITATVEARRAEAAEADVKVITNFEPAKKEMVQPSGVDTGMRFADSNQVVAAPAPSFMQQGSNAVIVDDFTGEEIKNSLGNKSNVYVKSPSRVMTSKKDETVNGKKVKALMIRYEKKNSGGPGGAGGWCGYYTLLKNAATGQYLDATNYKYITFWVKGARGDENFMVGLADEHWDKIGDSLKSEEIGAYLENKKITTEWQKARIPLSVFFLDYSTLSSISVSFEGDCFPEGAGSGTVFISDIAIEK